MSGQAAPHSVSALEALIALRSSAARGLASIIRRSTESARLPGGHASSMRAFGRGLSYAESRPYQRDDDVRSIDWRVTARHGKPFTKVFERERERPLWIAVDLSQSMQFGSRRLFKAELAARAAAWLAWSGLAGGDRVGGLVTGSVAGSVDGVILSPQRGERGVLGLVKALAEGLAPGASGPTETPRGSGVTAKRSGLSSALQRLRPGLRAGDRLCLIGDFYETDDPVEAAALFRVLGELAGRAEVWLFHVFDPLEAVPPPPGEYPVVQGDATVWLDLADPALREAWPAAHRARTERLAAVARQNGWPLISLATDADLLAGLSGLAARGRSR